MLLSEAVDEVAKSPNRYEFSPEALRLVVEAARNVADGTEVWWCADVDRIYRIAPTHCKRRTTEFQHRWCGRRVLVDPGKETT